ncbi:MAG: helix-turn-helix domain-containing protein [Deltaproteobacteria bacterium]|nr:helix-turn-helix domain-containing protein [Deltaproteobacteria bacterium]
METTEAEQLPDGVEPLWTAAQVAAYLGVHRNWVYANAGKPHLPCYRGDGLLRFDPELIRALARKTEA